MGFSIGIETVKVRLGRMIKLAGILLLTFQRSYSYVNVELKIYRRGRWNYTHSRYSQRSIKICFLILIFSLQPHCLNS